MNRRLAAERRAGELAAAVGDHLVHVHVELRAPSCHPNMEGKHVRMASWEDLITGLNDQLGALVVEPPAGMIGISGGFLQNGVRADHLARDQILPDAEMFKRSLGLRSPQCVAWHIHFTEAVSFLTKVLLLEGVNCIHWSSFLDLLRDGLCAGRPISPMGMAPCWHVLGKQDVSQRAHSLSPPINQRLI